ncbi:DUF4268 domain-containing protein [Bradyrhizobium sp. 183]|nr:DUF4268 domain-containing protein [Bradyrhizobium sp. 84]MCK1375692.1 DUF4268 domain-containing protein [Bradyrhizobium sp. 49]MCK1427378.1 DUF4268 domain-containing protein [Bradyrhizobium sp. 87]UPJ78807.1 DUF4268 domain-containing protein [Bradyrhizobium sp. 184]UPJ86600.1 DUF4268 domain-containing protein [Bradyrhizobium sp. 183]
MFKVNKSKNSIEPLRSETFAELGFRERQHLQEWIAKEPSCLGEELLIIQKEFGGFTDTNERLDLLAIDKQGSLVLIENKLDDTGRDVTWQALKYASYCSSLSKENIRSVFQAYLDRSSPGEDAKEVLTEFLDADEYDEITVNKGSTQRIILIAANFRKEVTSTILWLLNFKMRLQCFRVTPWQSGEDIFLDVDQIIPTKDAEEYMIGLAGKSLDEVEATVGVKERNKARRQFWTELLKTAGLTIPRFVNISPNDAHYVSAGSGLGGVPYNFVIARSFGRVELYIDHGDREQNKAIFDELHAQKAAIDSAFGGTLVWERLDKKRASRIKWETPGDPFDAAQRPALMSLMIDAMGRLESALGQPLARIQARLRVKSV